MAGVRRGDPSLGQPPTRIDDHYHSRGGAMAKGIKSSHVVGPWEGRVAELDGEGPERNTINLNPDDLSR